VVIIKKAIQRFAWAFATSVFEAQEVDSGSLIYMLEANAVLLQQWLYRKHQASAHVDQNRASAADAMLAADTRSSQVEYDAENQRWWDAALSVCGSQRGCAD
jgi:hypothetical protein